MITHNPMAAARAVQELHQDLLSQYPGRMTVLEVLDSMAVRLRKAHAAWDPAACIQISNWCPPLIGAKPPRIFRSSFSEEDARLTVLREHAFASWEQLQSRKELGFDPMFEKAVNAVVGGEVDVLQELLKKNPALAKAKSPYGHEATLLHYVAANGVEIWRQTVPPNVLEVLSILINAGANVSAKAQVYGGSYDTMALLMSSAHPAELGLTDSIAQGLRAAGSSG